MSDNERANNQLNRESEKVPDQSVFVMPNKFVVQPQSKTGKGWTLVIIILIAVIILTGTYLIVTMVASPAVKTTVPTNQNPPQIIIENASSTEIQNASSTDALASTTASSTELITATTSAATLGLSIDNDADGLTDIEETVLGALPTNPDSDGDGYKDGAEVASGYSPTKAGSARISESPFVVKIDGNLTSDIIAFLMPKDWQSSSIAANRQVLISASTGEIIKISISENRDNMTVLGWYLRDHPEASVSQLKTVSTYDGALSGIYSPDKLTAWLTDASRNRMYTIEYLTGRQTEIRYPELFDMIIKSITAITAIPETSVNDSAEQSTTI